ncbi:winged helix-turn-helix domain-containing protein [Streptomyces sp. NPDC051569]|uniref:winged helix-turn-helix domain-containing protein n=1 Tax=Streptomyces sp. NPDC051569 TaxID=3365661 RepID=UPI00378C28CA
MRLTVSGVGKYLERWVLSFQRPDKRAVEQDPQTARRRHEETWPEIRAKARRDSGEVLFADQVGVRSDQVTAAPGARRARRPWCGGAGTGSR